MKEVERDLLTEEELNRIYNKRFSSERLTLVKDIFIFSCYTGLAYVDVKGLKKDHIAIGIDGEKWIFKNRQKTDTKSKIPVLPIAQEIIQKYENHPRCLNEDAILPILTNQKMNSYLKEIGDLCDISKEITFHMARHTFATSVTLTNGVPIETVSKMLGHKNIQTTQHYAKILDKKVSEDMQVLRKKFSVAIKLNHLKTN
jgi:integrase